MRAARGVLTYILLKYAMTDHGGIWRTMHCRLYINCKLLRNRLRQSPPRTHTLTGRFLTINTKTTVQCSPGSSMAMTYL
jgi:hypothetical protein